jgi:hypothetical protein
MQIGVPPLSGADLDDLAQARPEVAALSALSVRSLDSVKGFARMVESAELEFRDTAERFRALHAHHADALARMLVDLGVKADADGGVMGLVNQAVVTFRAFFDDIDEDVMDQVRSGEDWILKSFDAAIAEAAGSVTDLRAMRAQLTDLMADTRDLG